MRTGGHDQLPFGIRPGTNENFMQPSFRDGPLRTPRRLWPIFLSVVVTLLTIAVLIAFSVLS
jgi:hypothetical protein